MITDAAANATLGGPYDTPPAATPTPTEEVPSPSDGWQQDALECQKRLLVEEEDAELQQAAEIAGMDIPTPTSTKNERERVESELDAALATAQAREGKQGGDRESPIVRSPANQKARTSTGVIVKKRELLHNGVKVFGRRSTSSGPYFNTTDFKQKKNDEGNDRQ